jgi:hypothetical protein
MPLSEHGKNQYQLCERLENVLDHFRQEYDMTYCDVIGCLDILKNKVFLESLEEDDDDGEFTIEEEED